MKKTVIQLAIMVPLLAFGGCSTYNAYAPDWAKIGASETAAEAADSGEKSESTWWNPFSW